MYLSRSRRESAGFATVWAMAWSVVVMLVGWVCLLVAVLVARQHQVDGSADLVALSGASRLQDGRDGCDVAAQIASANEVVLVACQVEGSDVVVEVATSVDLPFGIEGRLVGNARAGPEP